MKRLSIFILIGIVIGGGIIGYYFWYTNAPSVTSEVNYAIATTTWVGPNPPAILNGHYTADQYHVYMDGIVVKGVSPQGFKLLDDGTHNDESMVYVRDKNSIFVCINSMLKYGPLCHPIEGADPDSFVPLHGAFAKDNQHVFRSLGMIPGADPKVFKIITNDYSMDAQHVFYRNLMIPADLATFRLIGHDYSYDKNHIFCLAQLLEKLIPDKETIQTIANAHDAYVSLTIKGRSYKYCKMQ
jgi:hypothetical protein